MMKDYGTLEPVQPEERRSRKTVAAVAAAVLVLGALAVVGTTGFSKANSVVDSNLGRAAAAPMDAGVKAIFQKVCKNKVGAGKQRFAYAAFNEVTAANKQSYKLLPQVIVGGTDNFGADWRSFKNMLPTRHPAVAFAVYNFPVWAEPVEKKSAELVIPAFVSYRKESGAGSDPAAKYLGATYLGGAYLAASANQCTTVAININERTTYEQACMAVLHAANKLPGSKKWSHKQMEKMCEAIESTECPFSDPKKFPSSPCCADTRSCDKPCAAVRNWATDKYGPKCCAVVSKYCTKDNKGCKPYERAIYADNCNPAYGSKFEPAVKILKGLGDEDDKCTAACRSSCSTIATRAESNEKDGRAETYKNCAACATDYQVHKYGAESFVAKCHRDAPGFQGYRCCGMNADCAKKVAQEADKCSIFPSPMKAGQECKWMKHQECGDYIVKQKEATSPKGCCGTKNGAKQVRCCDGGKDKTVSCEGKPVVKFLVDKKCPVKCVGKFGKCDKGVKTFKITTKAANGGAKCAQKDGATSKAGCPQPKAATTAAPKAEKK